MKFRLTSVADEGIGLSLSQVLPKLEGWLNTALSDGQFGGELECLMIVVFATESWSAAPAPSRLTTFKHPLSGKPAQTLALHVVVPPSEVAAKSGPALLKFISQRVRDALPDKPLRSPRGLQYPRLRAAITGSLAVYV